MLQGDDEDDEGDSQEEEEITSFLQRQNSGQSFAPVLALGNVKELARKIIRKMFVLDELAVIKKFVKGSSAKGGSAPSKGGGGGSGQYAASELKKACNWFKPPEGRQFAIDCTELGRQNDGDPTCCTRKWKNMVLPDLGCTGRWKDLGISSTSHGFDPADFKALDASLASEATGKIRTCLDNLVATIVKK